MNWRAAAEVLGLPSALCPAADVRQAYARAVMADHPDHGGAGKRLAILQQARDVLLLATAGDTVPRCKLCRGSGKVRTGFGGQTCTACSGTGETK
jgi:DnaJ-class molecular chaperone